MKTAPKPSPRSRPGGKGEKKTSKGSPIPVRFEESDLEIINDLAARTALPLADIVRRAVRFAGPKFLSGAINIIDGTEPKPAR